jgi:hypothetical protein
LHSLVLAAALSPCQNAFVVNLLISNAFAALLCWFCLRYAVPKEKRSSLVSYWFVIMLSWSLSLIASWWGTLPVLRRSLGWQNRFTHDYGAASVNTAIWLILFVLAIVALARLVWRRAEWRWRAFGCIAASLLCGAPLYVFGCTASLVTALSETRVWHPELEAWDVYYIERGGGLFRVNLGTGNRAKIPASPVNASETIDCEVRQDGEWNTILVFTATQSRTELRHKIVNAEAKPNKGDVRQIADWSDSSISSQEIALAGPPREGFVVRDRRSREAKECYCIDFPFLVDPQYLWKYWSINWLTALPGGYVVAQIGTGSEAVIVLVDTVRRERHLLDGGQAPVVVRRGPSS